MTKRPRVFEQEEVEAQLRAQGVPESSIPPIISFMRLVIPLLIRQAGADGIVGLLTSASSEWGVPEQSPARPTAMATEVVKWAAACLEEYRAERFDADDDQSPS